MLVTLNTNNDKILLLSLLLSLPEPAKVMFWSACIYLFIYWFVCMHVCMLPTFLKNYFTDLHEIFRDDLSSSKDQSIRFYERSGQRSRSRSQKGQKRIFTIMRCFHPIHMKPSPKCSLFNSLSSDMVTNVALAKACALPSACSSYFYYHHHHYYY